MRFRKNKYKFYLSVVLFLLVFIGLGYSYLTSQLTINGSALVESNTWDIHFENIEMIKNINLSVEPTISEDKKTIEFNPILSGLGDEYSFTVDIKNSGTLDAEIKDIELEGLTENQKKFLLYSVTYDDGTEILEKGSLLAGTKKTLLVKLKYKTNLDENDLPETNEIVNVKLSLTYAQTSIKKLYGILSKQSKSDKNVYFNVSEWTDNTQGLMLMNSTKNNEYPIYYYRGNVSDNNVLFADYCWKIVRTTETGGVKLIYNGNPINKTQELTSLEEEKYVVLNNKSNSPFIYKSSQWISTNKDHSSSSEISFGVIAADTYTLNYTISSEVNYDKAYIYKDDELLITLSGAKSNSIILGNLDEDSVIKVVYSKDSSGSYYNDNVSFNLAKGVSEYISCDNTGTNSQLENKAQYAVWWNSPADVGYMFGTRYTFQTRNLSSVQETYTYGNDVKWNGYNYELIDTINSSNWSKDRNELSKNKHYTCFNSSGICSVVYYIYYFNDEASPYFFQLSGGNKLEQLKNSMFTNTENSKVKEVIDKWYSENLISYKSNLEDTVWCNDRSFYSGALKDKDNNSANNYSYFSAFNRDVITSKPKLNCPNKNDSFTVDPANGNGALTYPIGLLTADEMTLAGTGYQSYSKSSYLYTGEEWWNMTPYIFYFSDAYMFGQSKKGQLNQLYVTSEAGVRPSISLVSGIRVYLEGNGTANNPYIIFEN